MATRVSPLIIGLFVLADLTVEQHGQDAPIPTWRRSCSNAGRVMAIDPIEDTFSQLKLTTSAPISDIVAIEIQRM